MPLAAASAGLWVSIVLENYSAAAGFLCREGWGCDKVLSSRFSEMAGIKLSKLGVVFYSCAAVALICTVALKSSLFRRAVLRCILYSCALAAMFSFFLLLIQAFAIRAFCPLCCLSAVCSGALLGGAMLWRRVEPWPGFPLAACLLGIWPCLAAATALTPIGSPAEGVVLATVRGEEITEAQMRREIAYSLHMMESLLYETKDAWLKSEIAKRLLQREADQRGLSVETLLQTLHSASATAEEVRRIELLADFSGARKGEQEPSALERRERSKQDFVQLLDSRHEVAINLRKPLSPVVDFDLGNAPKLGGTNPAAKLVIFSDFECPFCSLLADRIRLLASEFPELLIAFKFFPLVSHPRSMPAALAAACAAQQGKFWEYHDLLFSEPGRRSDEDLEGIAVQTGIERQTFRECLADPATKDRVLKDYEEAVSLGIGSVPSVFLNGELIGGVPQVEELRELVRHAVSAE